MNIILFGFKGSGKTYYGKKLASLLDLQFVDLDEKMLHFYRKAKTVREIYSLEQEEKFRKIEKEVLLSLKDERKMVLSLGGGTILDDENRAFLINLGHLVFVNTPKEVIRKRLFADRNDLPAFLDPDFPEESFEKEYSKRLPSYLSLSAMILDPSKEDESINKIREYGF